MMAASPTIFSMAFVGKDWDIVWMYKGSKDYHYLTEKYIFNNYFECPATYERGVSSRQ